MRRSQATAAGLALAVLLALPCLTQAAPAPAEEPPAPPEPAAAAGTEGVDAERAPRQVRADPDDVEEVRVTATQDERLSIVEMEDIYTSQELGNKHFRRRNYEEAFPHLLATARRGFKTSQARLGYMYLHALGGVEYDPIAGVGWLAVAADPETVPWIRRYFRKIWKIVPERYVADLTKVTEAYRKRYGRGATGVNCNRNRRAGTHRVQLTCLFDDEVFHENGLDREAMRDLWEHTAGPNSHPGVVGLQ